MARAKLLNVRLRVETSKRPPGLTSEAATKRFGSAACLITSIVHTTSNPRNRLVHFRPKADQQPDIARASWRNKLYGNEAGPGEQATDMGLRRLLHQVAASQSRMTW
jgi:hypothetical protein